MGSRSIENIMQKEQLHYEKCTMKDVVVGFSYDNLSE
jgi:hypothetical protein